MFDSLDLILNSNRCWAVENCSKYRPLFRKEICNQCMHSETHTCGSVHCTSIYSFNFFKMAFGRFIKTLQSLLIPWYFWVTWILEISIDISAVLPVTVGVVVQFGGSLRPVVRLALDTEAPLVEREFLDALPGELLDDNSPSLEFVLSQQQGVDIDPHPNDIGSIVLTLKGTYYTWLSTLGYSTAHKAVKFCVWG